MKFINQDDFRLESYKITPEEFYQKKKDPSRPIVLDIRPLILARCLFPNEYRRLLQSSSRNV